MPIALHEQEPRPAETLPSSTLLAAEVDDDRRCRARRSVIEQREDAAEDEARRRFTRYDCSLTA